MIKSQPGRTVSPVAFICLVPMLLFSCASVTGTGTEGERGVAAVSPEPLTEISELENALVLGGWRLALPDSWTFYRSADDDEASVLFRFRDSGNTVDGTLEAILFESAATGVTLPFFLRQIEEAALRRTDRIRWRLYDAAAFPENLRWYYVLEELSGDTVAAITVVAAGSLVTDEYQPVSSDCDVAVLFAGTASATAADLRDLVSSLVWGFRKLSPLADGRYLPTGPTFYANGRSWYWVADIENGFAVLRSDVDGGYDAVGVRRADESFSPVRIVGDRRTLDLGGGRALIHVGSHAVSLEYSGVSYGREIALTGTFDVQDATYHLDLYRSYGQQEPPDAVALREILEDSHVRELLAFHIDPAPCEEVP